MCNTNTGRVDWGVLIFYIYNKTALIEAEEKNKYFQEKDSKQRIRIIE